MIVINSIIDIHRRTKLFPHTLYMTIWMMDKCLATGKYSNKMDELSTVCLFISAKYEETYRVPKLKDLMGANKIFHKTEN